MRGPARVMLAVGAVATLALAGCASSRLDGGVLHSNKGYRVPVPGGDWVAVKGDADLTLKHRDGRRGILVNATCDGAGTRGPLDVLARHLLSGLRERTVITRENVSVNGAVARHAVVEGRLGDAGDPVTVELYVMRDDRCLYDFLYVAPPDTFDAGRADFERLVRGFTTE